MNKTISILFVFFNLLCTSLFAAQTPTLVKIENNELTIKKPGETESHSYIIKGLSWSPSTLSPDYGPHPITKEQVPYGYFLDDSYQDIFGYRVFNYWAKNEFLNHYHTDIPLMKQMNINTVRTYVDFYNDYDGNPEDFIPVLDELYRNNIMVIMTVAGSRADIADGDTVNNWYYYVDSPKATFNPFVPTGWMGNTSTLTYTPYYKEGTNFCTKIDYAGTSETDWAGIYWQYPMNNWGDQNGLNLTGLNRLVVRMRGEKGGEIVDRIVVGGITNDTASEMLTSIRLSQNWREYVIELTNKDLSNIRGGFAFTIGGTQNCTIYLDNIKFIKQTPRYLKVVNTFKNHPAILAWSLGNEWNINYGYGFSSVANAASTIDYAATEIKKIDPNHPVISIFGDVFEPNQWLWNIPECIVGCPNIDAWGINTYRGSSFGNLFAQWKNIFLNQGLPVKPFFISEMGLPSFHTDSFTVMPDSAKAINVEGYLDEDIQKDTFSSLWTEMINELNVTENKSCLGGLVHEFNDELWKAGNYHAGMGGMVDYESQPFYRMQDTSGFYLEGLPSRVVNEEFFGTVNADRVPKEVFYEIQNRFSPDTAPTFETIPDQQIVEGVSFYYQVIAHHPENKPLTYSVLTSELPSGSSFDPVTQIFSWQPQYNQSGNYTIIFSVSDGTYTRSAPLNLNVLNVPLSVNGILSTSDNTPVQDAVVTISGDNITISATTDATGNYILQDIPANVPYTITPSKVDCSFSPASVTGNAITSNISNLNFIANRAPQFTLIGNKTASVGKKLEFTVAAIDPDNDSLIYSASNLPSEAAFNVDTRVFSWTPETDQTGSFNDLIFKVTDGVNSDEESIAVTVNNDPYPDLTLMALSPDSASGRPSGTLSISSSVKNMGSLAAAAFTIEFHLSTDTVFGGTDDIVLTPGRILSSLEINTDSAETIQVNLPSSILPGTYYLIAKADSANAVDEINEENNILVATASIQIIDETMTISSYESEVTDGILNATLDLAGLDSNSTYEVCAALFSSSWSTIGEKWVTATNGQVNIELNVAGFSGNNCHLQVYLFKNGNYSFSNPEAKEVRHNVNITYAAKKLSITNYESEVTDGVLNATLDLAGLDSNSTYEVCAALFSSNWSTVGEKWITVTNGQFNMELNVAGFSGNNCHLQVYLFKNGNRSFSNPEAKETRHNVNVVYAAKKLSITNYESEVTDGILNATLDLAGLDSNSSYEVCAALFSSDWATVGEKWITVTNGQVNMELNVAGFSGNNCHLQVYLFKNGNYSFSNPEDKEVRHNVNVVYAAKKLSITNYESEITDGVLNATLDLAGLDSNSSYEVCAALFGSDWSTVGEKWITVTNGQVNVELNVAGFSGSNCHLQVYLFKNGNYSFSNPEDKEVRNSVSIS